MYYLIWKDNIPLISYANTRFYPCFIQKYKGAFHSSCFCALPAGISCAETLREEAPWWQVDLGALVELFGIRFTTCRHMACGFVLFSLTNTTCDLIMGGGSSYELHAILKNKPTMKHYIIYLELWFIGKVYNLLYATNTTSYLQNIKWFFWRSIPQANIRSIPETFISSSNLWYMGILWYIQ